LSDLSAEELALRSRSGCKASFAELVQRYDRRLRGFLRGRTACAADAEDLVQDTFVKAYANLHRYDDSWKFSTWLYTIARRLAVSHYRRSASASSVEPWVDALDSGEPYELLARRDARDNLWRLAERLPPSQYRALWLRYAEAMPVSQISKVLGKSCINVKVLLHRARVNLARQIGQSPDGADIVESAAPSLASGATSLPPGRSKCNTLKSTHRQSKAPGGSAARDDTVSTFAVKGA